MHRTRGVNCKPLSSVAAMTIAKIMSSITWKEETIAESAALLPRQVVLRISMALYKAYYLIYINKIHTYKCEEILRL